MVTGLIVALDVAQAAEALTLANKLRPIVDGFKVGLELLAGPGPAVIGAVRELGLPVFVDAKLHDIPNTVEAAASRLGAYGARWLTVHASGGGPMIEAATRGLARGADGHEAGILAVTVLTSLDAADLAQTGVSGSPGSQVARLARLAASAGAEGVVCAVRELGDVAQVAPGLTRFTPGVRPAGADAGDQARVATPEEAARRGADYVVVGRPIIASPDPEEAARSIRRQLEGAATGG
ncbi:MAG TPA: orotidine-5'-phosphate decarboxylase [Acidimicrobiia bacterium]